METLSSSEHLTVWTGKNAHSFQRNLKTFAEFNTLNSTVVSYKQLDCLYLHLCVNRELQLEVKSPSGFGQEKTAGALLWFQQVIAPNSNKQCLFLIQNENFKVRV